MNDEYSIPADEAKSTIVVKNSKFTGRAGFTPSVEKAKEFLQKVKQEESGYSHAVYAYCIGSGNTVTYGMSDGGEPSGTAGRPVLEVVKGSSIGDITLVVIRYFGGTKLGTGGLVRAYTQSAQKTLEGLKTIRKIAKLCFEVTFAYEHYRAVEIALPLYEAHITEKNFTTDVCCKVILPEKHYSDFVKKLEDITAGKILIKNE
ncbi:MAG: YigZ family protein [Spirochaetales bacterium]|nr:YigZ family protein [Spirochaetales bacterium]